MTENLEPTHPTEVTAQELAKLIESFEQYRERLLNQTIITAQKAKMPQKAALARIEPELSEIDAALEKLRIQQTVFVTNN